MVHENSWTRRYPEDLNNGSAFFNLSGRSISVCCRPIRARTSLLSEQSQYHSNIAVRFFCFLLLERQCSFLNSVEPNWFHAIVPALLSICRIWAFCTTPKSAIVQWVRLFLSRTEDSFFPFRNMRDWKKLEIESTKNNESIIYFQQRI